MDLCEHKFGVRYDLAFKTKLLNQYCPQFWQEFPVWDQSSVWTLSQRILTLFKSFHENVMQHSSGSIIGSQELSLARAALLLDETKSSKELMVKYFTLAFKCYNSVMEKDDKDAENEHKERSDTCNRCLQVAGKCCCQEILSHFKELNDRLRDLGLLEYIASPSLSAVVYDQMKEYLETLCKDEFSKHYLDDATNWIERKILGWLRLIIGEESEFQVHGDNSDMTVDSWRPKLEYFLSKVYAELRISQLFEIIVEFPESLPAIEDLRECLEKTETRGLLTNSLKEAFTNRLLQPAVNTADILTQYISTIRTLRALDPSGVILENVCQPLREYLRTRDDTIKCIIMSLTDQESGTDLAEELIASEPIPIDVVENVDSDSDGEEWMPEPVDANIDLSSRSQRTADIINILVNIYGSKDLFVSEYRTLLADRILSNYSYDVSHERRYLELLKRRFGESHLHFCDIMLKDVQDSQRMNRHIKDQLTKKQVMDKSIDLDAFILSGVYWPAFKDDKVKAPEAIESIMESYTKEFETLKGMRSLEWMRHLGEVELDIELEDGMKSFTVNPGQAMIIMMFQEKDSWTISELCSELKISTNAVRSRLSYWIGLGVILEKASDVFQAAKSYQSVVKETSFYEDDESVTATAQSQREGELQVYWSYVVGMLTNIGSLPLDRIHSMLKMFAIHGPGGAQCTLEDVKQFLDKKVKAGELHFASGCYKLIKS